MILIIVWLDCYYLIWSRLHSAPPTKKQIRLQYEVPTLAFTCMCVEVLDFDGHFTCCSSNSVEKRSVTPLMRLEKEKDPPPYLSKKKSPRLSQQNNGHTNHSSNIRHQKKYEYLTLNNKHLRLIYRESIRSICLSLWTQYVLLHPYKCLVSSVLCKKLSIASKY